MDRETVGNYVLLVGMVTKFNQANGRLDSLNGRIDALNVRMDRMQADSQSQHDATRAEMNQIRVESNRRFDEAQTEMNRRFDRVDQRFDQVFEALRVFEGRSASRKRPASDPTPNDVSHRYVTTPSDNSRTSAALLRDAATWVYSFRKCPGGLVCFEGLGRMVSVAALRALGCQHHPPRCSKQRGGV